MSKYQKLFEAVLDLIGDEDEMMHLDEEITAEAKKLHRPTDEEIDMVAHEIVYG